MNEIIKNREMKNMGSKHFISFNNRMRLINKISLFENSQMLSVNNSRTFYNDVQ